MRTFQIFKYNWCCCLISSLLIGPKCKKSQTGNTSTSNKLSLNFFTYYKELQKKIFALRSNSILKYFRAPTPKLNLKQCLPQGFRANTDFTSKMSKKQYFDQDFPKSPGFLN